MEFKNIVFNEEKQMGFITLNRPDVYNALNHPLFVELNEGVEKIRTDSAIRVLILTGAGEISFASGADIHPS